jgi:C4-dicarboxylate transporter, DctM subunit
MDCRLRTAERIAGMGYWVILLMIIFMFLGMPVAFSLGVAGMVGLFLSGGLDPVSSVFSTVPFRTAAHYALSTLPMFILMANFISASKIVDDIFNAAQRWLERLAGGLAIATVFAAAGMAAMSGSSTASAASLSAIAVPQMRKHGYSQRVATGVVTVAGTLAIMIPPSISFVIYGIVTETSIGKLLIAGIIPGILTAGMYCIGILLWNKLQPGAMPPPTRMYTWKDRWNSIRPLWAFLILSVSVIGSMYIGLATPTEAAAFGAFGALIIPLALRRMTKAGFLQAVTGTVKVTTMIFTIIIGAMIFGYFLTLTQTTQNIIRFFGSLNVAPWVIFFLIVLLYLVLGCIMDQIAILLITLPLTFPLVTSLGYNPIWYGVIITKLTEIGLVTPPVGMNAYVVSATTKVPLEEVFKGTGVMLLVDFVSLAILMAFPVLSTYLPSKMMG